ncbi:ATP-dependent Clp protease proteolytic subunit [Blastococcus sp. CT_GayMR20]|uniref:ATP-dependent Clp protease proteolytic subunit n=1 Tax=Blastococcus sp. CT_GayMR20 TaxID=2559609 RepID=UPI00107350E2|nr:ATP-dependent Clp protease proteolytic subunit [Blastococcus sp. CT_GayMR20]TFV91791.1 ATP-dependent Clp protease proteolytic subunit [Blastococcus sp. CT_GayMR20]TFV91809.1 ATP-dependent Clp protease proteolytic subunit [Blastococcus sp. CT_GayMR20]
MNRPSGTYPPLPPSPPDPPFPRHTPWLPEPRPTGPGAVSASASMVVGDRDWLGERLLERRVVALAGDLDDDAVNRAIAALALLDATGDDPVGLRLSGVSAELDTVLPLVDALDLMGAPVHATALGRLTGPAVALLAVADHRVAGAHAVFHLCEPRSPHGIPGREVEALAAERAARLRSFTERLAEACRRAVEEVAADMRAGRLLDAAEARDYGLADATEPGRDR